MIRIERLKKNYGAITALDGIDLHVPAGELFAYLGPNGAGKTTTIRILTGLTRRSAGDAWLNGFHIEKEGLKAKKRFGLVMQSINLDQELTVSENLDIHGRLFGMSTSERRRKIDQMLAYVDLIDRKKSLVKQLSGGMKRRLTIARAMVHSPEILFLDEPTVGLDAAIRRRIWALIKEIQKKGTTIFLTTHYIEEAEFLADRVAFLDKGRIVVIDKPRSLMARTGTWAIDQMDKGNMKTVYFRTRQEADAFVTGQKESYTLRRVNLEDSFLSLTGKKVKC
ncbi:MAG: ATP-binding cassette domain-containing protein [Deltaproteobacteria bacterium]|nr:ATP-binding cassette domain-containing protein [Deltaproteobacteria bacterium]MBW2094954.1 ATP-binding cassette domain-containing protein [Deltaproteobacteria bacterium]